MEKISNSEAKKAASGSIQKILGHHVRSIERVYTLGRRWKTWQMFVPVISIIGYLLLTTLPDPIGILLRQLFPGWFLSYTPATLLKGLFKKDRRNRLHWTTSGQVTSKEVQFLYDYLLILSSVISFFIGWYGAVSQAITLLNEVQAAITLLVSGNFYGFFMGFVASEDRRIYSGII